MCMYIVVDILWDKMYCILVCNVNVFFLVGEWIDQEMGLYEESEDW